MKILIIGGDGMLGHQLFKQLKDRYTVRVTLHQNLVEYKRFKLFNGENSYAGIDVRVEEKVAGVLDDFQPDVVVNSAGVLKGLSATSGSIPSIEVNALFPHQLSGLCEGIAAQFIHLSTDCVFSGKKGNYVESDTPDAEDLYGRTKYLGEGFADHWLILRTSMIGLELKRRRNLLEWLLSQNGVVPGYKNAIFSGFTTLELSRIIEYLFVNHPKAHGVYHVSSSPISKYDLLMLFKDGLSLPVKIIPEGSFHCDRSLDSTRFQKEFGYNPPSWEHMATELCNQIKRERL